MGHSQPFRESGEEIVHLPRQHDPITVTAAVVQDDPALGFDAEDRRDEGDHRRDAASRRDGHVVAGPVTGRTGAECARRLRDVQRCPRRQFSYGESGERPVRLRLDRDTHPARGRGITQRITATDRLSMSQATHDDMLTRRENIAFAKTLRDIEFDHDTVHGVVNHRTHGETVEATGRTVRGGVEFGELTGARCRVPQCPKVIDADSGQRRHAVPE